VHSTIPDFEQPDDEAVERAVEMLRMLGDPTRFRILCALSQGESSVACLAELAGTTPTTTSQHLAKLRLAGVVKTRRQGTFMYYVVDSPQLSEVIKAALNAAPQKGPRKANLVTAKRN
jgi:ArsR family transcriptional regulator